MQHHPFPKERFGYHVVYDRDLYDAVDFAAEHGFGYIVPDLMIPRFFPENIGRRDRRRIKEYAEFRGISMSFHGPSDNLNLVAPYPEVRRAVLRRMTLSLMLAQDLGAERFTIHPTAPLNFASGGEKGTYLQDHWHVYKTALHESIKGILEEADGIQVEDRLGLGVVAQRRVVARQAQDVGDPEGGRAEQLALQAEPVAVAADHLQHRRQTGLLELDTGHQAAGAHDGGLDVRHVDADHSPPIELRLGEHVVQVAPLRRGHLARDEELSALDRFC